MDRVIKVGALSISTQPHDSARYQDLLHKVKNRRKAARIRGERFGYVNLLSKEKNPNRRNAFIQGVLTAFTQIDVDGDWFNMSTGKLAEIEERSAIRIPPNLRPNPVLHHFRFYLEEHLLLFEIGNSGPRLTPGSAKKLFDRFLSSQSIVDEFGEPVVTVVPKKDTISRILRNKKIISIEFRIDVPNPDKGAAAHKKWMDRLNWMDAQSASQRVVRKKDSFVKPDAELAEAATVAARSGFVAAVVKDKGRSTRISTTDTPYEYVYEYSSEVQTETDAFGSACDFARNDLRE